MTTEYIFLILFILIALIIIFWILYSQNKKFQFWEDHLNKNDSIQLLTKWLFDIRSSLDHNTDLIQRQVHSANQSLGNQLNSATHIMRLLNNDLGQIKEIGRQLNDFQHLFRTPNYRGQIGEHILADLINQVLPGCCKTLQHRFQNGHIVDALIRTEKGNIAIDSKFPTESFKKKSQAKTEQQKKTYNRDFFKDVKRHIQSVSQKYIVPAEGTLDFAVIYLQN
jgi:DNA recombination protein RmuC